VSKSARVEKIDIVKELDRAVIIIDEGGHSAIAKTTTETSHLGEQGFGEAL